jgi:hypothetical protein
MTSMEIQDYVHVYSMFCFRNGNQMAGIIVNKYNVSTTQVEHYFIAHHDMQAYKTAFEKYDRKTCSQLSKRINIDEVQSIRPVSLADYKIILQLMNEQPLRNAQK